VFTDVVQEGVSLPIPSIWANRNEHICRATETDFLSWIAGDKSSRIPISTFQTALEIHGVDVDPDEVECMVANMIFRVSLPLPLLGTPLYLGSRDKEADAVPGVHEGLHLS
jgi:hypothetical protein